MATLTPRSGEPVIISTEVQVLRYTTPDSSDSGLSLDPVTVTIDSPSLTTVQIPRAVYRVGEAIPLYITIPPPDRSSVTAGLRLRNVKAELIRDVQTGSEVDNPTFPNLSRTTAAMIPEASSSQAAASTQTPYPSEKPPSVNSEHTHLTVLRRSGAACRFHSSRPIKLRLVLHDNNGPAASENITQSTLLHHISFHIQCTVSYTSTSEHNSPASSITIPVVILPPAAPSQEGDYSQEVDSAYRKKHDPPPTQTNRVHDGEGSSDLPAFEDHRVGSSSSASTSLPPPLSRLRYLSNGFQPPPSFSEASASTSFGAEPPSFDDPTHLEQETFSTTSYQEIRQPDADGEPQSDSRGGLPSFIESENESARAYASASASGSSQPQPRDQQHPSSSFSYWAPEIGTDRQALHFAGEGDLFGFPPSEQYDGISHSMMQTDGLDAQRGTSIIAAMSGGGREDGSAVSTLITAGDLPPPGIEESIAAAVSAAFAAEVGSSTPDSDGIVPPPPPALDDPSDPPPSIDDGIHSLSDAQQSRRERAMVEAQAAASRTVTEADHLLPRQSNVSSTPQIQTSIGAMETPPTEDPEESRPPPYLGAASVAPAGPPPYVG